MSKRPSRYPPEAYAPDGTLWWKLQKQLSKNQNFGDERKMAAWLACTKQPGETFSTADIRDALGDDLHRNDKEHLQRRLRALRENDGWELPSSKHDRSLPAGQYRIDKVGWHPALGERPKPGGRVSGPVRLRVLKRDGSRCQLCGVGSGEPHPRDDRPAVMTVGHVLARELGGSGEASNLRVECSHCNEPVRAAGGSPGSLADAQQQLQLLRKAELKRLLSWLLQGHRSRDSLDQVYDQIRALSPGDKAKAVDELRKMLPTS